MKRFGYLMALTSLCLCVVTVRGSDSAVVNGDNVIVRAQPTRFSEVLARLQSGAQVTVLERVTIEKTRPDDESQWSRIALPEGVKVWVHGAFIEDGKVKANRLNLRAGPGENFSVLGQVENGAAVEAVSTNGDWVEVAPPEAASAYIASRLLSSGGGAPALAAGTGTNTVAQTNAATEVASAAQPEVEPLSETEVSSEPIPELEPTEVPAESLTTSETNTTVAGIDTESAEENPTSIPAPPPIEEPPPKRIVMREGIVKGTVSIQAPTRYELVSPFNGKTINYLYTTSTNLVLDKYRGLRIIVTGEEGLDKRWTNTPVITIQRIQVVEE